MWQCSKVNWPSLWTITRLEICSWVGADLISLLGSRQRQRAIAGSLVLGGTRQKVPHEWQCTEPKLAEQNRGSSGVPCPRVEAEESHSKQWLASGEWSRREQSWWCSCELTLSPNLAQGLHLTGRSPEGRAPSPVWTWVLSWGPEGAISKWQRQSHQRGRVR